MKNLKEFKLSTEDAKRIDSEERKALLSVSKGHYETNPELFKCLEFAKAEAKELGLTVTAKDAKFHRKDKSYLKLDLPIAEGAYADVFGYARFRGRKESELRDQIAEIRDEYDLPRNRYDEYDNDTINCLRRKYKNTEYGDLISDYTIYSTKNLSSEEIAKLPEDLKKYFTLLRKIPDAKRIDNNNYYVDCEMPEYAGSIIVTVQKDFYLLRYEVSYGQTSLTKEKMPTWQGFDLEEFQADWDDMLVNYLSKIL